MLEKRLQRKKIILVVESNEELAHLLQTIIAQQEHYRPVRVATGEQALTLLSTVIPDLMIVNAHLSDRSGAALAAQVRRDEKLKSLPLLLLGTDQAREDIFCLSLPLQLPVFLQALAYLFDL